MGCLRITILAFDGMEALDFAGPFEVFTTAARMHQRLQAQAQSQAQAWCAVRCVARLGGMALAERTARQMDFAWTRN